MAKLNFRIKSHSECVALFENYGQQTISNQPETPGANLPGRMGENPLVCKQHFSVLSLLNLTNSRVTRTAY